MRRVAVGVIGAGKHGQRYLAHLREVPELAPAAMSRRDAARGREDAARLGCRFHADWRSLVADPAVEAVVAVVPPALHPAVTDAVAAARKPLLIEKPLATTGAAAAGIVRVLRAAAVPCLMAHTLRWNAVVRAIRTHLPAIGTLRAVVLNQRFEPSPLAWLDDPSMSGGGILLHTGVHCFDLVRLLTGCEVTDVFCRTARVRTVRTEDNFAAVLRLAGSDTVVAVSGCRATRGRSGLIDLAGDGAQPRARAAGPPGAGPDGARGAARLRPARARRRAAAGDARGWGAGSVHRRGVPPLGGERYAGHGRRPGRLIRETYACQMPAACHSRTDHGVMMPISRQRSRSLASDATTLSRWRGFAV